MIRLIALMLVALILFVEPASAFSLTSVEGTSPELTYLLIVGITLGTGAATLLDHAKRLDPDGNIADIVELLMQDNEILLDAMFVEGNLPTGDQTTVRTGLPTVAWRLLNAVVTPSKSTTAQITEHAGILEAWSEVDIDLAKLNGNTQAFRLSEGIAFLEAMNQEMASTMFYGNSGLDPEEFTGLSPRYSVLPTASVPASRNVLDGGGSDAAENTSVWLITWGERCVRGIFPKGSVAGLQHDDYGEQTIQGSTGIGTGRMRAFQERWQWKAGISVKNWQYACRIANIDVEDLVGESSAADLLKLMTKATYRIKNLNGGRSAFYANRTVMQMLDIQATAKVTTGGGITYDNVDGKRMLSFRGIPIRVCDALLETEDALS